MARLFRIAILLACILFAERAFAQGGACPTGANYLNPSTQALVTLSSLGVTTCYFIAANGSDANSGTSEASPWLHAPQMPNCSSACATFQNAGSGIPAGTGIIFRGGDTWYMSPTDSHAPNTGGTWNFNSGKSPVGTSSNPIYLGVDPGWYSGASWARPIITGDNPLCNSSTVGTGGCTQNTNTALDELYYVTSCAYQNASGNNTMMNMTSAKYIIVDNFEWTGLCESAPGSVNHNDDYFNISSLQGPAWFLNNYVHGWSHLSFADHNGGSGCTGSTVCFNIMVFSGGTNSGYPLGETILKNVIDGTDSDPGGAGFSLRASYNVAYNVILNTSQSITANMHLWHDNIYGNFYENGHSNLLESNNAADNIGTNAVYNNVFYNLETSGNQSGGEAFDFSPPVGSTDYFFNNLIYNIGNMEIFAIGNHGTNNGAFRVFNNTWQVNPGVNEGIFGCPTDGSTYSSILANNHFITENTSGVYGDCAGSGSITFTTDIVENNANATTYGYTAGSAYAYIPTSSTCNGHPSSSTCTVGNGTNETSTLCSALTTAASSDSTLSDAASACQSDTRYACAYNTSNHTVTCPARTGVAARSSAWNIGAYQFSGTQANAPNPPSSLAATVQP